MDEALFRAINSGLDHPVIGWLMVRVTTFSTWVLPLILLLIGMVLVDRRRGIIAIAAASLAVGIGDPFTFYALKSFFARARPCIELENINVLVGCVDSYSFPSNHAVNSMAVVGAIGSVFRPLLWVLLPIGLLVCLSRVVVGVHYPMDVIVGGAFGICLGVGVAMAVKKMMGDSKVENIAK
ncbi:hypothetical protein MNBD_NITROSPINAE04-1514 [hydrothermal vent metagenome]|uniref:Phosphatidic acid phosphatase type 2/haloperoxidase domain-containing protein n=1 Tax=hydrothermal vent metagenome TaxID=652676 RepID=A0A3B1BXH1_9ZZZZ